MIVLRKNLKSMIVKLLSEADTVKRNLGKSLSSEEKIKEKIAIVNGMATHAFTMTRIEKLGINPQYSYGTPLGIYFYPLDQERYRQLIQDDLPFVSGEKQFSLVRIKNPEKWLNVGSSKKYNIEKICKQIVSKFAPEIEMNTYEDFRKYIGRNSSSLRHWKINSACRVLDIAWLVSQRLKDPERQWSRILSYIGFEGVYDPGLGVIYEGEPAQLVAFSKSAVESVEMFSTPAVRRDYRLQNFRGKEILDYIYKKLPKKYAEALSRYFSFLMTSAVWDDYYSNFYGIDHIAKKKNIDNIINSLKDPNEMHVKFIDIWRNDNIILSYPESYKIREIFESKVFRDVIVELFSSFENMSLLEISSLIRSLTHHGTYDIPQILAKILKATKDIQKQTYVINSFIYIAREYLEDDMIKTKIYQIVVSFIVKNPKLIEEYMNDIIYFLPDKWSNYVVRANDKLQNKPEKEKPKSIIQAASENEKQEELLDSLVIPQVFQKEEDESVEDWFQN